jgi:hypothetical protein
MKQNLKEEILRIKGLMTETTLSSSDTLFGGDKVSIPDDGSHAGQKGWQSGNAWDIPAEIGTPVYAVADGTLLTFNDYGPKVKEVEGKRLFGISFTVDSDYGLPDVYYAHLKNPTVNKGDHIKCGQLIGYVMDFPDSSFDHLHIGVEDNNIKQFLTSDGKIKCNGKTISIGTPVKSTDDEQSLLDKILNSEFGGKKIKDLIDVAEDKFASFLKTLADVMKMLK